MPMRRPLVLPLALAALFPALAACNALTGAGDLVFDDSAGGDGGAGSGSGPSGSGAGAGSTGQGTTGATMADPYAPVTGVTVQEIALYQGVKRPLMVGGAPADSTIPVVRERDALIRVFYATDGGYNGGPVTARLELDGQPTLEVQQTLSGASADGNLASSINFEVPAASMLPGTGYRVSLLQPKEQSAGDNPGASFPASGTAPLGVDASPSVVRVELVPIAYAADGSNRTPDTSQTQLNAYKDLFYGMYPATTVELTVHEVVSYDGQILSNGSGWDSLLTGLADFRAQENAPDNVYYYGIFQPTSSIQSFCGGGCVAGLGFVGAPADAYTRVAIGLGYSGSIATETAVHEIGHTHGRSHAPCGGASGTDQGFPHSGGKIGVWGYNQITKKLFSPTATADVMGYCSPIWVSDYTYRALFNRIQYVDGASLVIPPELLDRTYDRVRIDAGGNATFLEPIQLHRPPMAEQEDVTLESPTGVTAVVAGQLYRYDHLEGGLLIWPRQAQAFDAMHVEIAGKVISATR